MGQFGQELRREREAQGVSVDAICAITKVSYRHVEALEEGRLSELPGGVFRKGIVRSYLAALHLEESTWMERFERNMRESGAHDPEEQDWVAFAENVKRGRGSSGPPTGLRWFGVALILLGLAFCGWVTWKFVIRDRLAPASTLALPHDGHHFPSVSRYKPLPLRG